MVRRLNLIDPVKHSNEWLKILAYIRAKRTNEPAFKALFQKLLNQKSHKYHRQVSLINDLYDFPPTKEDSKEIVG